MKWTVRIFWILVFSLFVFCVFYISQCFTEEETLCDKITSEDAHLIVKSGDTFYLDAGKEYIFTSILIHKGATLKIVGKEPKWTTIKSKKDFRLAGTIEAIDFMSGKCDALVDISDPDDLVSILYTYPEDGKGGKGGAGGRMVECNKKSCLDLDCFKGEKPTGPTGGKGGPGMSKCDIESCKKNDMCTRGDADKTHYYRCKSCALGKCGHGKAEPCELDALSPGKGKEGGKKGKNGGLIYLAACGDFLGRDGTVNVSGSKGESGKAGESGRYTGGGGGGGGAGGNGGMVYFNIKGYLEMPTINKSGGKGGKGGKGGIPHKKDGLAKYPGSKGKDGGNGNDGKMGIHPPK